MVGPKKKDYSSVKPDVIMEYKASKNILRVARMFKMSPNTVRRILGENNVFVGSTGVRNCGRKKEAFNKESCAFCHKYSRCTPLTGYCMKHRRTVAAHNIEPCFN